MEKLRNLYVWIKENAKVVFYFVVIPVSFVAGVIYYLVTGNKNLKQQLAQAKAEKDLTETLTKKEIAKNEADKAQGDYESVRDAYKREHPDDK